MANLELILNLKGLKYKYNNYYYCYFDIKLINTKTSSK